MRRKRIIFLCEGLEYRSLSGIAKTRTDVLVTLLQMRVRSSGKNAFEGEYIGSIKLEMKLS